MEKARWAAKKMEKWKCAKQKKNSVSTGNGRGCSPCVAFDCLFERNAFCTNPVFIIINHILFSFFIPILVINRVSKRNKFILD